MVLFLQIDFMVLENIVGPKLKNKNSTVKRTPKTKKKTTKDTKVSGTKILWIRVEQYDMVGGVVQANAGIIIGQLVWGHASTAAMRARKVVGEKIVRNIVAMIVEKGEYGDCTTFTVSKLITDPQ